MMRTYERIFGAGPRGILISLVLLALAWRLEDTIGLPGITTSDTVRWTVFSLCTIGTGALLTWSVVSLPPAQRGRTLVTKGAYGLVRHPVYAAFLSCFNFGLAVLLDNWIYVAWAVLLHFVWHWNVRGEEALMRQEFPGAYETYCEGTGRFLPRVGVGG